MISSKLSSREFLEILIQENHIIHRSELSEDHFHEWAMISSNFSCRDFLRSLIQESHNNYRIELSGDHFHEWAMISSKFSCRDFLEIFNTREPHHSQKWAIWRPFSWVGDDFVQFFMSRFLEIFNTREPQQLQNWAVWRPFSWVGDDFVEIFMSRFSRDLQYKRATSFTEVSYLKTIFMSGRWFRPNFLVESFSRSLIQENHIIHRSELSEDHFHEWAMISSNFSCRDFLRSLIQESHNNYRIELSGDHFLELALISSKFSTREFLVIYNTREPHQSQKWAIWRQFSWVGDDFVEIFMSRVSRNL